MESEMSAVLPCGKTSNKPVPKQGKQKPEPPPKKPKTYKLKAKVRSGTTNVTGAKVTAAGATVNSNGSGVSDFGKKAAGAYQITVAFAADSDYLDVTTAIDVNLGADTEVPVAVAKKNQVSVKIEPEFKVIPLDRKLSDLQAGTEVKVVTGICSVKLTFEQTNTAHQYSKKATFTCTGAGAVDIFTDEACTIAFNGEIPNAQIVGGLPKNYFLKSKTAGKFNAKVVFEDPADPKVKLKKVTVEEPMSVAEIKLQVFMTDQPGIKGKTIDQDLHPISNYHKNLNKYEIPEQKVMSDSDKVTKGRFLHLQENNNHGRAKIIVKIDAAQWLDECNDYELYVAPINVTGSLDFYDAEWKGTKWDKTKPIKISDLKKKKGEKELWVEGTGVTDKLLDVKLGITLNRPAKGPAHTEKKNADWARFTVVKVEEVKLDYTQPGGEANAWDDGEKKFYINFKVDPDGRKITIKAKLSTKIAGVPIHFMLAGDKGNGKAENWGMDMPKTWKWNEMKEILKQKDRTKRDDFLHLSKETDAEGEATMELTLSRIGGEKFTPGCYIHEDPHLAKYIHGHSDLEKKKPKLSTTTIQVWRKFWVEQVCIDGATDRDITGLKPVFTKVKATMELAPKVRLTGGEVAAISPQCLYPEYMVKLKGGAGNILLIADTNKREFFNKIVDDATMPIKVPIVTADAQWDAGDSSSADALQGAATDFPKALRTDVYALTPPLQGGDILDMTGGTNTWEACEIDPTTNVQTNHRFGVLGAGDVTIDQGRTGLKDIVVALPAAVNPVADTYVWVRNIVIKGADGIYLGESFEKKILSVWNTDLGPKTDAPWANSQTELNHTVGHELGHAFKQKMLPATATGLGLPATPNHYQRKGSHCNHKTDKCIMYGMAPVKNSLHDFCPICHPYLLVQDFSQL